MDCEASVLQFSESSPIRDTVHRDKPSLSFLVLLADVLCKVYSDRIFAVSTFFFFFPIFRYSEGLIGGHSLQPLICAREMIAWFYRAYLFLSYFRCYMAQKLFMVRICRPWFSIWLPGTQSLAAPVVDFHSPLKSWRESMMMESSCENVINYAFQLIKGRLSEGERLNKGTEWLTATDQSIVRMDRCIRWN
jgi:hypothetical protein